MFSKRICKFLCIVPSFLFVLMVYNTGFAFSEQPVNITFYFPVVVGGKISDVFEKMSKDFMKEHPHIIVKPIYTGGYKETMTKSITALRGGEPPNVAVLLSTDLFSLLDEDAIVPFENFQGGKELSRKFFSPFMENSQFDGKTWGIPFQRSTIVLFWNKKAFEEAGLDPNTPPQTWDELIDFGKKLTKKNDAGVVTQWGVSIPTSNFAYWMFQALCIENDHKLMNSNGTKVYFNDTKAVEALTFLVNLSKKDKIMPNGVIEWATLPKDFFEGKTAMMWTTTGNLSNVKENASFDFGVAILPKKVRFGSPTGGGNFYIFNKTDQKKQEAAFEFVKWMTSKDNVVDWSIETGYVPGRPDAWKSKEFQEYIESFPEAEVALEQLKYSVAELSTHESQRINKILGDAIQAAINGEKTPQKALDDAQKQSTRILSRYR